MLEFPTAKSINTYYLTGQIMDEYGIQDEKNVIKVSCMGDKPKRGHVFTANEEYYVVTSLNPPAATWKLKQQKENAIAVVDTGKTKIDILREWLGPFIDEIKSIDR